MSLINEALHNLDERQGASAEEIVETQPAAPPPKRRSSFAGTLRGTLWIAVACGIGYVVWTTNPTTVLQMQSEAEAVVDNLLDEAAVVIGALWDDQEAQQSADGTNSTGQGDEAQPAPAVAPVASSTAAVTTELRQPAKLDETPVSTAPVTSVAATVAAPVAATTAAVVPEPSQAAKRDETPVSTAPVTSVAAPVVSSTAAVTPEPSQGAKLDETPVSTAPVTAAAAPVASTTAAVTPEPSRVAKLDEAPASTAPVTPVATPVAAPVAATTAAVKTVPEQTTPLASASSETGQATLPGGNVVSTPVQASGEAVVAETPAAIPAEISSASAALTTGTSVSVVQPERRDEGHPEGTTQDKVQVAGADSTQPVTGQVVTQAAPTPMTVTQENGIQKGKSVAPATTLAVGSERTVTRPALPEPRTDGNATLQSPTNTVSMAAAVTATRPNAAAQREVSALQVHSDTVQLQQLLRKAQAALEDNRLTLPVGRSAYDYYNAALRHSPSNVVARRGLEQLPAQYERLIRQQMARGDAQRARFYLARYKNFGWTPSAGLIKEVELGATKLEETSETPPTASPNETQVRDRVAEPALDLVTLRKLAAVNGDAFVVARLEDAANGDVKTLPRRHREYLLELYIKTGSHDKAAALVAVSGDNTNEMRLLRAQFYYRFESLQRAVEYLAPIAAGNEKLVSYLAALYQKAGDFQAALNTYQSLLLDDPANGRYLLGYALAADSLGADLAAIDAYARALSSGTQGPSTEGFIRQRLAALR